MAVTEWLSGMSSLIFPNVMLMAVFWGHQLWSQLFILLAVLRIPTVSWCIVVLISLLQTRIQSFLESVTNNLKEELRGQGQNLTGPTWHLRPCPFSYIMLLLVPLSKPQQLQPRPLKSPHPYMHIRSTGEKDQECLLVVVLFQVFGCPVHVSARSDVNFPAWAEKFLAWDVSGWSWDLNRLFWVQWMESFFDASVAW